jgi:hypothetical protein
MERLPTALAVVVAELAQAHLQMGLVDLAEAVTAELALE